MGNKHFAFLAVIAGLLFAGLLFAQEPVAQDKDALQRKKAELLQQLEAVQKAKQAAAQGDPQPRKFKTGAVRTPLHKVLEALRLGKATVHQRNGKLTDSVIRVPGTLSMLGNDQYGDCVTAESCFSMEAYSVGLGLPEIVIADQAAISWASAHGVLNGADLLSVIQGMEADGIKDSNGTLRKAGVPATVNYSDAATLKSAIALGPVSIAIGSGDLPNGAGNANGWYALNSRGTPNDHCVDLCAFGKAEELFKALGVPVPAACAGLDGYLCYTWSTIGFVNQAWVNGTVQEAWVRNPTVTGLTPPTPPTPPTPVTVAVGDVAGTVGVPVTFLPIVAGGTPPYVAPYIYDYGDGIKDGTGSHTYPAAGTFNVSVTVTDSKGVTGTGTCKAVIGVAPPPVPPTPPVGIGTVTFNNTGTTLDGQTLALIPQATLNRTLGEILSVQPPSPPPAIVINGIRYVPDTSKKGK